MSDRARGKNHPQDPRQPPVIGSGRNRPAKGYGDGAWEPPEAGEPGYRCPSCGNLYDAKMRTPADEVCFECRYRIED